MFNYNKSFGIAFVTTLLVAIPVLFLEIQYTQPLVLGGTLLISLAAAAAATHHRKPATKRRPVVEEHRVPYNKSRRESGSVKWFNASKGFGFITRDSGEDIFVHFRSIRGEGHRVLHDGQRVEFAISEGEKGLQAEDVAAAK